MVSCDWEREWKGVSRPRSELVSEGRFWDFMAKEGTHLLAIDRSLDDTIFDFIRREGLLTDGGSVLDVGAGLGNYAFLFAQMAGKVDCLDISPAMVGAVRERAKAEGIGNITAKLSDWENFETEVRYDLVFSSFCPAVEGQTSLLRMEGLSKGFCCYVALSGSDRDHTEQEIWQRVHGGSLPEHSHEAILPFNLLYCLGRNPSLRTFSSTVRYEVEEELLCQYYLRHLSRMGDLDQGAEAVIREVVRNHCDDGVHKAHGDFTVAMIYWRPPQ